MPLDLAVVCDSFSLGGTAKAAVTYALHHDPERFRVRAVALEEPGVRAAELEAAGLPVHSRVEDPATLAELIRGVDVVHTHRSGTAQPLLPQACRMAGVSTLVETNVFGWMDASADEQQFSAHLFISQMCSMRYRQKAGLTIDEFLPRHRTLCYPVDVEGLRAAALEPLEARRMLGLDPSRPTVVRVGRDDDRKWADILVQMTPHLFRLIPDAQVLFVGCTARRRAQLERLGTWERIRCVPSTSDPARIAAFYSAADVFASASSIGESFGLAIAEAMAIGRPVVTSSTPWTDNAQVEVVDNGVNGWVANHPRAFAEAVADLLTNSNRRAAFGQAAAEKATRTWHPVLLTRRLEDLFEALVGEQRAPSRWSPDREDEASFQSTYESRAAAEFRPLSRSERRARNVGVLRERAGWVARDVRANPVHSGRMLAHIAASRLPRPSGTRSGS